MWKTVSARIRGASSELTEMGEDTDGMVESTSKLRDLVKGITGFDIMEDEDTFKDIYTIVVGIAEKWDTLSDIDQASLLEALAGKNQSNALVAALSNVDLLKKSYEEATSAEGSARKEQEEYTKSVQYSIDQAKASLEELANDFLSSDFLKGAIEAGEKLIDVLDLVISDSREISILFGLIGGIFATKNNIGLFKSDKGNFTIGGKTIGEIGDDFNKLSQIVSDKTQKINSEISTFRDNLASNKEVTPTWSYGDIQSNGLSKLDESNYSIADKIREQNEYNELLANENSSVNAAIELSRRRTESYDETLPKLSEINAEFEKQRQLEAEDKYTSTIKERNNEYEKYLSNLNESVEESKKVQDSIDNISPDTLEELGYKEKSYLKEIREGQEEFSDTLSRIETAPVDSILPKKDEIKGYYNEILDEQQEFQNQLNAIETTPLDALAKDQYAEVLSEEADGQMALNLSATKYNSTISAQNELSNQRVLALTQEADGQMALTLAEQEGVTTKQQDIQQSQTQLVAKEALIEAANKELLNNVNQKLAIMGVTDASEELTIAKLKEIAASDSEAGALARETLALFETEKASKAATIALKGLALVGNMLLSWALGEVVTIISDLITASDRLADSAAKLGSEFSTTKSEISDYKTQIEDLYKTINDSNSSYEDTYNARQELLSIQDEMIEKFGDEADAVDLVTKAINGYTTALDYLTDQQWQETINEFNRNADASWSEKIADNIANIGHGSNYQRMIDEMEDTSVSVRIIPDAFNKDYDDFLDKIKEDYGATITSNYGNNFVTLSGDLETIYNQLLSIQTLSKNMGLEESISTSIGNAADDAKSKLEEYQDFYSQHVLQDTILNNEAYTESFKQINDAYEEYQDAFSSGDDERIEKAKQNYAEIIQEATEGVDDQSVIDYFNNMYPELQEIVGKWRFEVKFTAAIDDDTDNFENEIKDALGEFDSVEDIKGYNSATATEGQKEAHLKLEEYTREYGLSLDQLIDEFAQLSLINYEAQNDLLNKLIPSSNKTTPITGTYKWFTDLVPNNKDVNIDPAVDTDVATEWVQSLTDEEAKLANSTEFDEALDRQKEKLNGATLSAEDYETALQAVKDAQNATSNETPISATITSSVQQIATQLEPQFAKLGEAYQSIFTSDGFTLEDVDNSMLEGLRESFAEIEEEVGVTFDSTKLEGFFDALTDGDANAESVQQAFNDLATAYFYSTDTLENLNEVTADSIEKQLEELGVTNAQEVVYDALNGKAEALSLQKQFLAQTGSEVVNATASEVSAFLTEANASETARAYLMLLQAQEQIYANSGLNVEQKIIALQDLATQYGNTALAASVAAKMEEATKNAAMGGGSYSFEDAYNEAQEEFNQAATNINLDFSNIGGGTSGASSAGSDAADAYLEAFEDELEDLQGMRDRGEISEKEYLDRLRELYQRYFKDREEYLDEYEKYEQEYLEGMESLYNDALSGITKLLGNKIDAIEEEKDVAVNALEAEKEAAEEAYQAEIDALEERKNANQDIIDNIQDEIDAINDAADAREREITLMQARYNLQRAMSQRVKLVNDRYAKYYSNII